LERLLSWHKVLDIIHEEIQNTPLEETILIDPDSRLSQLGVLPLFPEAGYFFFDSRSDKIFMNKLSMPELVNAWLSCLLGEESFFYPRVWIDPHALERAQRLTHSLLQQGAQRIVVVNFGYGGNPRKRVGLLFEVQMLLALLKEPHTVVILDRGLGLEEAANTEILLKEIQRQGYPVEQSSFGDRTFFSKIGWGVLGLETRIGEIASLISCSHEFIGYDSACQHIAAALEIPCITIFAGSNNMRFIRRWSAFGKNSSQIVHADTLNQHLGIDVQDIVTRVMHQRQALRAVQIQNLGEVST
jgi:ADP-heptose:LPS heptosyltransferase